MDEEYFEGTSLLAIGRRLELTRRALGYGDRGNQRLFAEKAGIANNTFNQWEQGAKRPAVEGATALCEHYGLTLDWIYRGEVSGLSVKVERAIFAERTMMITEHQGRQIIQDGLAKAQPLKVIETLPLADEADE